MDKDKTYILATRIKLGDSSAFRDLFRLHYSQLYSFVVGFVKDSFIAEDIVQNVFMKIWISRESIDDSKPLRGYLYLLCRREMCDWFRKEVTVQKFVSGFQKDEIVGTLQTEPVDHLELDQLQKIANEVICQMPPKRRDVFTLSRKENMSIEEIAKRMEISPRTVNKHIQLALSELRKYLKNEKI